MNKVKVFLCAFVLSFALCGCDIYVYQQPANYKGSVWVCDEPQTIYYVLESPEDESGSYAVANIDGEEILLSFWFRSSMVRICKRDENGCDIPEEFSIGECRYSKEKFTVNILEEHDKVFAGNYKTLIFKRQ